MRVNNQLTRGFYEQNKDQLQTQGISHKDLAYGLTMVSISGRKMDYSNNTVTPMGMHAVMECMEGMGLVLIGL